MIETQNKLEALEERQDREGNVTKCRIKSMFSTSAFVYTHTHV